MLPACSGIKVYIGSYNGINELFHGLIDDLRIWNVARTQEEIQATMYTELQGDEPGLVAYYRFNTLEDLDIGEEGFKVDDVRDWSGNDNHGDLVGDALLVDSTAPIDVTVIAGIISGAENGAGLSDVLVELLDNTESVVESTSTTANGYYRFDDIPEGQYRIRASKLFYHSTESERFDLASQEVEYVALTIQPEQGQYGLNLDGDGDYVEIPDDDSLDIADEITIETWFKYPGGMDDTHTWTTEFTLPYQGNQNPGNQRIA
ncbi:MAG: carboxypeptidase regulatory-like domain-containing protein [Candidatus Poribacteria bacterium]